MNTRNVKKLFVASVALVAVLGLSACHHWRGYDHGDRYYGSSHVDEHHRDRGYDHGGHHRPGYRH